MGMDRGRDGDLGAPEEAKRDYRRKQAELDELVAQHSRVEGQLRVRREELARTRREMERYATELARLAKAREQLERMVEEFEQTLERGRAKVSALEHEVESLREDAYRRRH